MHIKYPHFLRRDLRMLALATLSVAGSFAVGIQTVGEVQPIRLIEAGSAELAGDVDGNGVKDVQDAMIILEIAQGYRTATPELLRLDPNGDGRMTVDDALAVLSEVASRE